MRLISKRELSKKISYSPQHIMRMVKEGRFVKPLQLGPGRIAWREDLVDEWIKSRPEASYSHEEE